MDIMNVEEYKTWIGGIARRFKQSQIKAATAVNVEMLENNIASNLHLRQGNAETNFDLALPDPESDLAKETYDFRLCA